MTEQFRLSFIGSVAAVLAGTAAAASGPVAGYGPATPEPGIDIPQATVTFGMRPYADNTFYVIGMEKGWFKDVGITIAPPPYGLKTTESQWVSILLSGHVNISSATCSILLPSYRTTDQLKCLGFSSTFFGSVLLANPRLGLKPLGDYMSKGAGFKEGLRQTLTPLVGKTVYVPIDISEKEFSEIPFQIAGIAAPTFVTMDDSQMLLLAKSGRLDFVHPAGAPIAQTLLDAGWIPVFDTGQLLKFGPGGLASPLEPLVSNNGWAATADYVNSHKTTVLRFASVVFRILGGIEKDPALYGVYAPYLNSVAGTSLDANGVRRTVENLDPFVPFEKQEKYFANKGSPEYYANSMGALITSLEKTGAIRVGIRADDVIWAAPMYHEIVDYKNKTDALFEKANTAPLSDAKQRMLIKAHQYYEWYDFLDAYRLASAALGR